MIPDAITKWHEVVATNNYATLASLLAEDAIFESPVVHTKQIGKDITFKYLMSALEVLNNDSFVYRNEWYGVNSAVLEFQTVCDEIEINGVDMITWNTDGYITHFKVMVRPLKAMQKLHELMGKMLQSQS